MVVLLLLLALQEKLLAKKKTLLGFVVWDGWDGFDKPVLLQAPAFEIICGCVFAPAVLGVEVNGNFAEK
jgi:hypothetical protein